MGDSDKTIPPIRGSDPVTEHWTSRVFSPALPGEEVLLWPEFLAFAERLGINPANPGTEVISIRIPVSRDVTIIYECVAHDATKRVKDNAR